jgi:hypothetical protein
VIPLPPLLLPLLLPLPLPLLLPARGGPPPGNSTEMNGWCRNGCICRWGCKKASGICAILRPHPLARRNKPVNSSSINQLSQDVHWLTHRSHSKKAHFGLESPLGTNQIFTREKSSFLRLFPDFELVALLIFVLTSVVVPEPVPVVVAAVVATVVLACLSDPVALVTGAALVTGLSTEASSGIFSNSTANVSLSASEQYLRKN